MHIIYSTANQSVLYIIINYMHFVCFEIIYLINGKLLCKLLQQHENVIL